MADARLCLRCGGDLGSGPDPPGLCPGCAGAGAMPTLTHQADDGVDVPVRIGRYRLLRQLGEGGMGTVYLAEQREPVRRRVALKVIKDGSDSRTVLARFASEQQALAILSHQGIARVFDAGVTDDGRPYFAMEYVAGLPITAHCDARNLGLEQRLDLFLQVCEAIQHAHHKGIIHRDIKPSNVLVGTVDDAPVVKVIDFGVAKAIDHQMSRDTLYTQAGSLLGTPEYMSPEQAGLGGAVVDMRSDIYSLGVLLYELLVGVLPFDTQVLRAASTLEMLRILHEKEPPRPTTRISRLGEAAAGIARQRRLEPRELQRRLRGELEWITMRALEKDPAQRYGSASELAADIRRHLADEPVLAGPPGTVYRLRKLARRHRLATVAAAVLVGGLVVGVAGLGLGMTRARQAEARATVAAADASREAATSRHVVEFLVELFEVPDPGEARGSAVTAREILAAGAGRIREELADEPEVQARLMATIGRVYGNLGLYASAESLLTHALSTRKATFGETSAEVAETANHLAQVLESRGEYDRAEEHFRRSLAIREALRGRRSEDVATVLNNLAALQRTRGKLDDAEALYREALDIDRALGNDNAAGTAGTLSNLALLMQDKGDLEQAELLQREALALQRASLGTDHPNLAVSLNNLGMLLYTRQDLDEAVAHFAEALDLNRRVLGDRHAETANVMGNLATAYKARGDLADAETLMREALQIRLDALGPEHAQVGLAMAQLAGILVARERHREAAAGYRRAIAVLAAALGDEHWLTAQTRCLHGACLTALGAYREAETELLAGFAALESALGSEHVRAREAANRINELYAAWGRPAPGAPGSAR